MSGRLLKILVCGDVNGQFDALIKRVNAANKKGGPFDILFCVGEFFGVDVAVNRQMINSLIEMPITTYILGPCCSSTCQFFPEDGVEFSSNLIYLGKKGILNTVGGLRIAYLSGIEGAQANAFQFTSCDMEDLLTSVKASAEFPGLDILLTSMWPAEVSKHSTNRPSAEISGSCLISKLATGLKPRYHFAGMGVHYERTPYRNHQVLQEAAQHVTRFIGLAAVNNPQKEKWLYAFSITPVRWLSRAELTVQPPNTTEFPYMELVTQMALNDKQARKEQSHAGQYFFDMSEESEDQVYGGVKRRRTKGPTSYQPREQQPCWFCLSNVDAEQYLIVSVASECYLAMPKGPLTDDHVMILTTGHTQSMVAASQEVRDEIKKFKEALTLMYDKQGKVPVFFERNYKTQHLQVQVVPVPKDRSRALRSSFLNAAELRNLEIVFLKEDEEIWDLVNEGCPYFIVELPDGSRLYTLKMRDFPLQFGREVLAGAALLDCEEKVDWRSCELDKAEQTKLVEKLQSAFKPFDFADNEDDE